jgi:hypothetical protein
LSDDPAVVEVCGGDAAMRDIFTIMNLTGLLILAEKHARELDLVKDKTGGTVLPKLVETMKALENSSKTVAAFHNPILKGPFDELRVHASAVVDMHKKNQGLLRRHGSHGEARFDDGRQGQEVAACQRGR